MKSLRVTFSNGEMYDIPIDVIAENRATYYASKELDKTHQGEVFTEEMKLALEDTDEITDWAFNNMDWKDVIHVAKHVEKDRKVPNYNKEWTNVKHKIV